jgi:hypothetical protein
MSPSAILRQREGRHSYGLSHLSIFYSTSLKAHPPTPISTIPNHTWIITVEPGGHFPCSMALRIPSAGVASVRPTLALGVLALADDLLTYPTNILPSCITPTLVIALTVLWILPGRAAARGTAMAVVGVVVPSRITSLSAADVGCPVAI